MNRRLQRTKRPDTGDAARQSQEGRARETLRAEQGKLERADAGGTAVYSLRIRAEYTQLYTEETP